MTPPHAAAIVAISTSVDIFTIVNTTRSVRVFNLFKRRNELVVEFCDGCGSVCDSDCRRVTVIERARDRTLAHGPRIA